MAAIVKFKVANLVISIVDGVCMCLKMRRFNCAVLPAARILNYSICNYEIKSTAWQKRSAAYFAGTHDRFCRVVPFAGLCHGAGCGLQRSQYRKRNYSCNGWGTPFRNLGRNTWSNSAYVYRVERQKRFL